MNHKRMKAKWLIAAGMTFLLVAVEAAQSESAPPFGEVYGLLRSNLTGIDEKAFDQAAVRALLREFKGQAQLVSSPETPAAASEPKSEGQIERVNIYDDFYGYLRAPEIGAGSPEKITAAIARLNATNKLKGLILDLRFARGSDLAAAAAVADLFIPEEKILLTSGVDVFRARAKTNAVTVPLTILVNQETTGAGEALAAILRNTEAGLLIGAPTSGKVGVFRNFPLSNGQVLRVATAGLKLGNGQELAGQGLTPDILVELLPEAEKAYWEDAYRIPSTARLEGTNTAERVFAGNRRMNEAELVRRQREGLGADGESTSRIRPPRENRPSVADPVLARALDLLKGLALVQEPRGN